MAHNLGARLRSKDKYVLQWSNQSPNLNLNMSKDFKTGILYENDDLGQGILLSHKNNAHITKYSILDKKHGLRVKSISFLNCTLRTH